MSENRQLDQVAKDWGIALREIDKIKASIDVLEKEAGRVEPKLEEVERELQKLTSEKDMLNKKVGIITAKLLPFKEQLRKAEEHLTKLTAEKHKLENEK